MQHMIIDLSLKFQDNNELHEAEAFLGS